MKLVPINMDYHLFQLDALKLFLEVRLHGASQPNFSFLEVNFTIWLQNLMGYIEKKIKLGTDSPHKDGPLRQILRHQIEIENNPC